MKKISRRNMIEIAGLSAAGSLVGVPAFSKSSGKSNLRASRQKIIVMGAHPGDPECGCGGAIALFASQGHSVVSAYLTRGGAGIQGKSYEEAAKIRTDEALKACKILHSRPAFLEQIDGNTEITTQRYTEVNNFIAAENPDIVFTHWPIDSHRDHQICSVLTHNAWVKQGKKFALYYYEVTSGYETQNFAPTNYINIGSVIKQKSDSCLAHISQDPAGWYENIQRTIERFRGIELNCEFAEAFVRHNQSPEAFVPQ
ncbi:MAG: PIG-L family deacetylase [Cyclobacteriaceae bacterium]|nr:PIG-L family deacetylase [Cyclobacteriaceae bacterium]MDH4298922.1 PIG-L family deacetylase [Cyclobacteriaceae bacterium]MDH5249827.1 PIG-L family deacetylase [Cyclobacteriaceae bacterium]